MKTNFQQENFKLIILNIKQFQLKLNKINGLVGEIFKSIKFLILNLNSASYPIPNVNGKRFRYKIHRRPASTNPTRHKIQTACIHNPSADKHSFKLRYRSNPSFFTRNPENP